MGLNRRHFLKTLGIGAAVAAAPGCALRGAAKAADLKKPNVIFVMADDMGYGDAVCNNAGSKIPTPNFDRLAREGMRFTDAHTPSAVCTPTRYGVVTGRYSWRTWMKRGVLNGYSPHLINPDRLTVGGLMKANGYHTGVIGKWHLGFDWAKPSGGNLKVDYSKRVKNGPNDIGFDYSFLVPASLDMPPYVYLRNGLATEDPTDTQPAQGFPKYVRKGEKAPSLNPENALDDLLKESQEFVRRSAKNPEPFFLYFPFTAPHKPVQPHKRFQGKSGLGPYGDFVMQVDWTLGAFLKTLDKKGVADNTLLMFSSDNGSFMYRYDEKDAPDHVSDETIQGFRADHHRANYIFRGTKADIWEGGHHVAFFARWPGKIKPGSTCDETICLTDLMATCADVVGATLPRNAGEDSFSALPHMLGKRPSKPRPPVIHQSGSGMLAIRDGKWKMVLGTGSGGREKPSGKSMEKPYILFDMSKDISETHNVAAEHPEVVERLTKRFHAIHDGGRSDIL